eukprot:c12996_g1_i1 orf=205-1290(-)
MENFTIKAVAAALLLGMLIAVFFRKPKHIMSLRQKHVLITGGSTGIGFSLAKICLSEGAFVTLMSRTQFKLNSAHETLTRKLGYPTDRILLKAVDVSDDVAVSVAIKESFDWRPVDMLICNAGQIIAGEFDKVKVEDLESVTKANILGCVLPLHAALPLMKSRSLANPSSIVIVGLIASLSYLNNFNMYTPTKVALKGLAEYLMIELMPYNIPVSFASLGYTETQMLDEVDKVCETSDLVRRLCDYKREHAQSPDDVATKIIEGAKKGDLLITTNLGGFFIGLLGRGCIPADSFARTLMELVLSVPARIMSFVVLLRATSILQKRLQENLKGSKHEEVIPYAHNIDDSAADDDANLDLWSH